MIVKLCLGINVICKHNINIIACYINIILFFSFVTNHKFVKSLEYLKKLITVLTVIMAAAQFVSPNHSIGLLGNTADIPVNPSSANNISHLSLR